MTSYALIADPDPVTASDYAAVLRQVGLTVFLARGGTVAVAALVERGLPLLLLTELTLPGQSGLQLIESLRRSAPSTRTRVIAVSADRALRDRAAAVRGRLGIGAILAKAASEDSVRRVILRLLGADLPAASAPLDDKARAGT
jgi:two-component system nitrogen regulation response regulator GlnG